MYLALSYDHRIIDGKSSVGFLCKVKQCLEDPKLHLMDNKIEKWTYTGLDEVNKAATLVKEKMKTNGII